MTEVERKEWDEGPLACRGCGRKIELWFNGGELDTKTCCGYVYTLEHTEIDLVIIDTNAAHRS